MRFLKSAIPALALALVATGCTSQPATGPTGQTTAINVSAAFYPLAYIAQRVGGGLVNVTNLTTPGQEAHDLEISPKQMAQLNKADLALHLKGFQSQVDLAVDQAKLAHVIEAGAAIGLNANPPKPEEHTADAHKEKGHNHGASDPHFWLDPTLMAKLAATVKAELVKIDPANQAKYSANLDQVTKELTSLDTDFKQGLAQCKVKAFIVSHEAFGYLAKRYNLRQIGISGLSPETEPSPKRVAEVHTLAKEHNVTTIFYETLTSPGVAKSIAGDLGLKTAVLDPVEGLTDASAGKNYIEVMRSNLVTLKSANRCS